MESCPFQKLSERYDADNLNAEDSSKFTYITDLKDWSNEELVESIRVRFVTLKSARKGDESDDNDEDDDTVYGDFEDLETGKEYKDGQLHNNGGNTEHSEGDGPVVEERRLKKLALRAKFDAQYPFHCHFAVLCFILHVALCGMIYSLALCGLIYS